MQIDKLMSGRKDKVLLQLALGALKGLLGPLAFMLTHQISKWDSKLSGLFFFSRVVWVEIGARPKPTTPITFTPTQKEDPSAQGPGVRPSIFSAIVERSIRHLKQRPVPLITPQQ